jgi:hypothetical protein
MVKKGKQPKAEGEGRSILINFVLDKSGSMDAIRDATISGFNEFKNTQAAEEGQAFFTLTLFDTRFNTVCKAVPMREVIDLDYESYAPDGMTALYDAIGYTMRITDDFVLANKPDQVLFVIMTDGYENASREFSRERIFQMIQDRQNLAEYEFIYLGANQDSYHASQQIGMRAGRSVDYAASDAGSREAMTRASHNVSAHRRHGTKLREEFFSAEVESLGAIDPETWKRMSPEERKRHLGEDEPQAKGA